jgi:hypothetical protein
MLELPSLRKGTTLTKEMFFNNLYGRMDEPATLQLTSDHHLAGSITPKTLPEVSSPATAAPPVP